MFKYYINKPIASVFAKPGDGVITDELLYGWEVSILAEDGEYYKIISKYLYEGFIRKKDVTKSRYENCLYVTSSSADVMPVPSYKAMETASVFAGSRLSVAGETDGFYKVVLLNNMTGYVKKGLMAQLDISLTPDIRNEEAVREGIVKTALSYMSVQYRWGGKTAMGTDCSGLAFMSYMLNGVYIFRDSKMPEDFCIKPIPVEKLKKGDLIYIPGHVMIYMGDNRINHSFIHASMSNDKVHINSLDETDSRFFLPLKGANIKFGSMFT